MSDPENKTSCEWFEASIAASLYESLPEAEQARLDTHLAACPPCRQSHAELSQLIADLPADVISGAPDLWPMLNRRISTRRTHWSLYAAVAVFLVVIGANVWRIAAPTAAPAPMVVASPVQLTIERAATLAANHDFMSALKELQVTLAAHPGDPAAGNAQMTLAEIEFAHGQRYAEAYEAYDALKNRYPDAWKSNPLNADRLDLLTEAHPADFEPLYALNAAKNSAADPFPQLEQLAARPEGFLVGALAVDAMRELVGGETSRAGEAKVAALEKVRDRCKDPVAAAQVKIALAQVHWKDLHDTTRARDLLGEVAKDPQPILAQAAQAALAKLEATPQVR